MRRSLAYLAAACVVVVVALGTPPYRPQAWAADAPSLLFASRRDGKQDLYLINADGTGERNLTRDGAGNSLPSWSPDGKRIVFSSSRSGNGDLYVMDAEGGNLKQLTSDASTEHQPAWAPDGKRIAFCRHSGEIPSFEIYTIDADGGNQVNLSNQEGFDGDPAWSPDGREILFVSTRGGNGFRLYRMESNGANVRPFPVKESGFTTVFPAWSPDGKKIAYTDPVNDATEIFTCDADGANRKQITAMGGINTFPAWAPDGKQLAFEHYDNPTATGSLWVTDASGVSQSRLGDTGPHLTGRPAWRPR